MKEIYATLTNQETKLVETTETKLNVENETLFVIVSLNVKRRNLTTSRLLHSSTVTSGFHHDLFLFIFILYNIKIFKLFFFHSTVIKLRINLFKPNTYPLNNF